MKLQEILQKYPFDPNAIAHELRGLEKLRSEPDPAYREMLVSLYLACETRWQREETAARTKVLQAQSREYLDESERRYP